jgi:hypothetical protein
MDSRFNIPAPPTFKPEGRGGGEERGVESPCPARGRGGHGRCGFFEAAAEKSSGEY